MTVRVAVFPVDHRPDLADVVREAGADIVDPGQAEALIWTHAGADPADMRAIVDANPGIRWVHLGPAGIERWVSHMDTDRIWTCGKGVYARPVAEHTLALMLAGFRRLHTYSRATSWGAQDGRTLFGAKVAILGGGGIAELLARMLTPFGTETTVVRNRIEPMPDVARVVGRSELTDVLATADQVVLALALTPETTHIIDAAALDVMQEHAWLVNVARGRHVDTDALVAALHAGQIGGAALDVTDPEPLPDGHPLWTAPNVIITPHTANPRSISGGTLVERIQDNVRRFAAGKELVGRVNVELGY